MSKLPDLFEIQFIVIDGYPVKDELKQKGFRFRHKHKTWFKVVSGSREEIKKELKMMLNLARSGGWTIDFRGRILKEFEQVALGNE